MGGVRTSVLSSSEVRCVVSVLVSIVLGLERESESLGSLIRHLVRDEGGKWDGYVGA